MPHQQNLLLASLSTSDYALLLPNLRTTDMKRGVLVADSNTKIDKVLFPHDGMLSYVVALEDGGTVETGMVGKDGVMGAGPAMDDRVALNKVLVQVAGSASTLDPSKVRDAVESSKTLRSIFVRHSMLHHAHAQQSAACNAAHTVEARMCRWLLRLYDLVGTEQALTQEFLAQMLGVRRTSVTLIAQSLQEAGLIKYKRGHITILDLENLKEAACECYETGKEHHALLFGDAESRARELSNR